MSSAPTDSRLLREAIDAVRRAHYFLVDWDGCLVENGLLKPGAHRFLRSFSGRVSILSNNSTDTPEDLSLFLIRQGLQVPVSQIFLAGDVTLRLVAARVGREPIYLLANETMREQARRLGLSLRMRGVREVVLLRDTAFTFARLERAINLLRAGAPLVVANPDVTHPRGAGVAPETGALLAALASCVDLDRAGVSIVGKPEPMLFERALAARRCAPADAVMIGDGALTDIAGADRLGIPSVRIDAAAGVTLDLLMRGLLDVRSA